MLASSPVASAVGSALARPRGGQHFIDAGDGDPALGEQVRRPLHDPPPAGASPLGFRFTRHAPHDNRGMYQAVQYVRASSRRVQNCWQAWPFAFHKWWICPPRAWNRAAIH